MIGEQERANLVLQLATIYNGRCTYRNSNSAKRMLCAHALYCCYIAKHAVANVCTGRLERGGISLQRNDHTDVKLERD